MVNFLFEKCVGGYLCVCLKFVVLLNVTMFVYVMSLLCVHRCVCWCIYWYASLHVYSYFSCLLVGTEKGDKGRECEKSGWGDFLFLSNFMVTKSLF